MEAGMTILWLLVFGALYYERQVGVAAILFVLGVLSGAIPVSMPLV